MPVQQISNETNSIAGATYRCSEPGARRSTTRAGRRGTVLSAALIAALLLSGCSSTPTPANETQAPSAESETPTESTETEVEAPTPDNDGPLTCDRISEFVAAEFGDVQFDEERSAGPKLYCYWGSASTPPLITVTVSTNSKRDGNGSLDLCEEDAQMTMLHGALDPEDFSAYNGCLRVQPLDTTAVNLWVQAADELVEVDVQGAESPREKGVALIRQILDAS